VITPVILIALALGHADASAQAQAVEKALVSAEPKLHRCWEAAAANDFKVEGKIDLTVVVGAQGKADKVAVRADSIGQRPLADCVVKAFADASFGNAFAPGDSVEVPVTFKSEPNVTVKAEDVSEIALKGVQGTAKVLIDKLTAGADKASLVVYTLAQSSRMVRPRASGAAFIYVRRGNIKIGSFVARDDDVVVLPDGSAPAMMTALTTELDVLYVPPGGEQDHRAGKPVPQPTAGPEPRLVKANEAHKYEILGGKNTARIYVENSAASVTRLRITPGTAIPEHAHAGSAEVIYVTEGKGELTVDGEKYPVGPFTAIYIPPGAKHAFVAADRDVKAIQFYTPSGPEQRFKDGR
jgi:quercetin dioxygenase-like cupin family protein